MSRKFVLDREVAFVNEINKELLQKVNRQEVYYYAIVLEKTRRNRLYNESVKKTWAPPVKINALVDYDNSNTTSTNMGNDSQYSLEVYFHTEELTDRNVSPKEGDFIEYGEIYYEITSVTQPQTVFGQINNKIMTKCTCVPSREGQFAAGSDSTQDLNFAHPLNQDRAADDGGISGDEDDSPHGSGDRLVSGSLYVSGSFTTAGNAVITGSLTVLGGYNGVTAAMVEVTPSGNLAADDVQEALQELQLNIDQVSGSLASINLVASNVVVTPSGNLESTNAQAAFQELQLVIDQLSGSLSSLNLAASNITVVPAGSLGSTNVQDALEELEAKRTTIPDDAVVSGSLDVLGFLTVENSIRGGAGIFTYGEINGLLAAGELSVESFFNGNGNIKATGNLLIRGSGSFYGGLNVHTQLHVAEAGLVVDNLAEVGSLQVLGESTFLGTIYTQQGISSDGDIVSFGNISASGEIAADEFFAYTGIYSDGPVTVGAMSFADFPTTGDTVSAGALAYATDLEELCVFDGTSWSVVSPLDEPLALTQALTSSVGAFLSLVPNGATAVAYTFDTSGSYTTSGAKLLSIRNAGTEKLVLDVSNTLHIYGTGTGNAFAKIKGYRADNGTSGEFYFDGFKWVVKASEGLSLFGGSIRACAGVRSQTSNLDLSVDGGSSASTVALSINTNQNWTHAGAKLISIRNNSVEKAYFDKDGKLGFDTTDSSGSPGAVTINKPSGAVAIAAGTSSVTVTNSLITAASVVHCTISGASDDATLTSIRWRVTGSSLVITGNAAATGNVRINFVVMN